MGFLEEIGTGLDPTVVITDPELTAHHGVDWTRQWSAAPQAVLRPRSPGEVAAIVSLARRHGTPLVSQGGNTGLVGGAVPRADEVVVDLRGLDRLDPVDVVSGQVTVGAGVSLARLQAHAAAVGMDFAVDLGARDTATIGGMVATNAGGLHVVRHGTMRSQVLGVEAVLGTGDVVAVNLSGLVKDNSGYDLVGLLCGSEGTLAIVTAVRLRLIDRPAERAVACIGLAGLDEAVAVVPALRLLPSLAAVEVMRGPDLVLVAHHLGSRPPIDPPPPCMLLVELAGDGDLLEELGALLDHLDDRTTGSAVAIDDLGRARLWRWREAHPEAAASLGLVHKADVSVPIEAIADFAARVEPVVHELAPAATVLVYGHLGDGNLHVNVVGPETGDETVLDEVLGLALDLGGSVSAEHGIGVAKRHWLERQRGPVAVAAMRSIKAALDPDGILNPGVLLPV